MVQAAFEALVLGMSGFCAIVETVRISRRWWQKRKTGRDKSNANCRKAGEDQK